MIYRPPPLGETTPLAVAAPPMPSIGRAMSEAEICAVVREVTDEEVAH